jgi:predicted alpha/beta-fold hydrolase
MMKPKKPASHRRYTEPGAHPALDAYRAPVWLPGGHIQTIVTARLTSSPKMSYRRERWETPNGDDFIDVDFTSTPVSPDAPLLVMFHGLESCSQSHYARDIMRACEARGWQGAVPHFRGCSGEINRLPRAYHSGDSREIDWIVRRFKAAIGSRPLYLVGVSLGGNAMLKWLGEETSAARPLVESVVAISAPLDLEAGAHSLSQGFNRIYTRMFLKTLIPKTLEKIRRFPDIADPEKVRASRDFYDFDELVTAPLHGFQSAAQYWRSSASKPYLRHIEVPTLLINARNDPFMPGEFLPAPDEVSDCVTCYFPAQGGHVGFPSSRGFPAGLGFLPERIFAWFLHQIPPVVADN